MSSRSVDMSGWRRRSAPGLKNRGLRLRRAAALGRGALSRGLGLLVGGACLSALFAPVALQAFAEQPQADAGILRIGMIELVGLVPGFGAFVVELSLG